MGCREARWPKFAIAAIAIGLLAAPFAALFWHPAKRSYFEHVSSSCSEAHGLAAIPWRSVPTFDAKVEEFAPTGAQENAVFDCIERWAGMIIADEVSKSAKQPLIRSTVTGYLEAIDPPQRYFAYELVRPAK